MNIIDFHTHILPRMDDGSHSVGESLEMLRAEAAAGIKTVAVTPHFYADLDTPETFLKRRSEALEKLEEKMTDGLPDLLPGAEVAYFEGMKNCGLLSEMTICGTGLLLIEMPMGKWSERMFSEILQLAENLSITPLLAHIDRYGVTRDEIRLLKKFVINGGLIQANAGAFLHFATAGKMIKMINDNLVHLLGSDCHNVSTRPPNLGEAVEKITKKAGPAPITIIEAAQSRIITR